MSTLAEHDTQPDPQQGAWLVYINGIQVPCPQVNISYGVWKIPEATISLAPHRVIQRLGAEDRLEVVVFYLDTTYDPANPKFRLCFEGEILGWAYNSSPFGRMMTFNAIADIAVFQSLYFFFMNTVDAVVGYVTEKGKDTITAFTPGVHYPFSLFKQGLFVESATDKPDIRRPYDLLSNILRGMLSSPPGKPDQRPLPCVNFYARWARKRNFVNRIVALPLFEDNLADESVGAFPIFKSVQAEFALKAMQTSLSESVGDQGTIFDLLQKLCGMAYCELAMIPTPACYVTRSRDGTILRSTAQPGTDPHLVAEEPLRLGNYFVKPQMLFGIAPACNLIFPSMIENYSYSENFWQQPTRAYVNDQFYASALNGGGLVAQALTVGYPEEIDAALQMRRQGGDSAVAPTPTATGKNVLVFPEEFFKGPVVTRMPVPAWFTHLAGQRASELRDAGELADTAVPADTPLHELFFLYSQYEYFRSRYEQRGGAVEMLWNPYIVPGFPCNIFDHREGGLDTTGYVLNVSQTLSLGGMKTSMNYSFGRTINELFDTMKNDMSRLGVVLASAPADPVDSVRAISQDFVQAEQFYNALFFGREQLTEKKASADLRDIVGFVVDNPDTYGDEIVLDDIIIGIETDAPASAVSYLGNDAGTREKPMNNLGESRTPARDSPGASRDVEPKEGFRLIFANGTEALKYIARPICTLEEYISFLHGGESLATLSVPQTLTNPVTGLSYERPAQVEGPRHEYSYLELVGGQNSGTVLSSAIYYERIRALRPGPGDRPPSEEIGSEVTPPTDGSTVSTATPVTDVVAAVPADFPQTRLNWDTILLAYRELMLDRQAPLR